MLKTKNFFSFMKRDFSSKKRSFKEVTIKVPWGHISGKWWEPFDKKPILTLHGWQDNCGSFDRLLPLLNPEVGFLAIDFPGHGYSSYISQGSFYHYITTYVLSVRLVKEAMKWPKITIMGHSMGGVISYMYALLYPQEVDALICLDGSKPVYYKHAVELLGESLVQFQKTVEYILSPQEPPSYTREELVAKVSQALHNSVLPEYSKYLLERNIAPSKIHKGKFYFTVDPRVKALDIFPLSQEEVLRYSRSLLAPIFIVKCKNGPYFENKKYFYDFLDVIKHSSVDCECHHLDGTHHLHLNSPESIAGLLNGFISKHYRDGTSYGEITEDIIVDKKYLKQFLNE